MNVGRILLGWLAIGVMVAMIVAALMASGLISIHVETISDEDEEDGELDLEEKRRWTIRRGGIGC